MRLLLKNIRGLVGAYQDPPPFLAGRDMRHFPVLEDAWLAVEDGRVVDFGSMSDFPGIADWSGLEILDCDGRYVLPAWCDGHTHLVYAGHRAHELQSRLEGLTYAEIAARGGGILHSAERLEATSEADLLASAWARLEHAMRDGIGAMEVKTGYGLSVAGELKSLAVIRSLRERAPIPIRTTLLGLHAVPRGYRDAAHWTQEAIEVLLPQALDMGGVDYVDAFCEAGYFGLEEVAAWTEAAQARGIRSKWHVNQFQRLGGVARAAQLSARSVDHLEICEREDIEALQRTVHSAEGPTFPVVLPNCSHFLSIPYAPARAMVDAGLPVVIATDHNPGSAPSGSMTRAVQRAIVTQRLLPLEAIAAATLNGAAAMDLAHEVGTLSPQRLANFILTHPLDGLIDIGYRFDENPVAAVYIRGRRLESL
ncbi:MAG: hypothetical protein RJA19_357 [Bacteroidota bacterium]